ncbi:hypothetical protein BY458DRAFT_525383 [Sporodiniella umbellata]|nr:hypothetical protein BY458DRAFT_525383 [Sporodiniella umbellata]
MWPNLGNVFLTGTNVLYSPKKKIYGFAYFISVFYSFCLNSLFATGLIQLNSRSLGKPWIAQFFGDK